MDTSDTSDTTRTPPDTPRAAPLDGVGPTGKTLMRLRLNGDEVEIAFAPHKTLLEVLREDLGLTGTKHGCELGECGACVVLVREAGAPDGTNHWRPVLSCLMLALEAEGADVRTIEGLQQGAALHPLQAAFADLGAAQCGYCTPAMLLTAEALLDAQPDGTVPTRDEVKEALSGVLCRCTGYVQIFDAVERAARAMRDPAAADPATTSSPPATLDPATPPIGGGR